MKLGRMLRYSLAWLGFVAMGYGLTLMFVKPAPEQTVAAPAPAAINPPSDEVNINAIDIALASLGGEELSLAHWQGRPMIINFWATWCAPCRKEIPLLKALQDEFADDDLTIVGVAIDEMDEVKTYAEDADFNYPILVSEEGGVRMASAIGVVNFYVPITAFVDRNGAVKRIHTGEVKRDDALMAINEIITR